MSTISIQAHSLPTTYLPRGARIGADLFTRFLSLFTVSTAVADANSRADEAEHVRSLARRVQATDPGFASDLFAAAARHEGLDE